MTCFYSLTTFSKINSIRDVEELFIKTLCRPIFLVIIFFTRFYSDLLLYNHFFFSQGGKTIFPKRMWAMADKPLWIRHWLLKIDEFAVQVQIIGYY